MTNKYLFLTRCIIYYSIEQNRRATLQKIVSLQYIDNYKLTEEHVNVFLFGHVVSNYIASGLRHKCQVWK